jgi:hypothetical protein
MRRSVRAGERAGPARRRVDPECGQPLARLMRDRIFVSLELDAMSRRPPLPGLAHGLGPPGVGQQSRVQKVFEAGGDAVCAEALQRVCFGPYSDHG